MDRERFDSFDINKLYLQLLLKNILLKDINYQFFALQKPAILLGALIYMRFLKRIYAFLDKRYAKISGRVTLTKIICEICFFVQSNLSSKILLKYFLMRLDKLYLT